MTAEHATPVTAPVARDDHYNFGYLDESTKRMLRRALLKAVAIPGYQVPFGSREMPLPYGWGTGGIQVTAAIIGRQDVLKVIDQGSDDTTNAINIRRFFGRVTGVQTTERTAEATIIQTRHRIPETKLRAGQTMVYQVPIPEPLRWLEPSETETRTMHALAEYGSMHVKLYEDIAHHGHIATTYDYPVIVNQRYMMRPSPIPKFDNPKLDRSPALMLFGAGREKRVYAVPPYTSVRSRAWTSWTTRSPSRSGRAAARSAAPPTATWTRSSPTMPARACSCARTPSTAPTARPRRPCRPPPEASHERHTAAVRPQPDPHVGRHARLP